MSDDTQVPPAPHPASGGQPRPAIDAVSRMLAVASLLISILSLPAHTHVSSLPPPPGDKPQSAKDKVARGLSVGSLVVSILSFTAAATTLYFNFIRDNPKFLANVAASNYLDISSGSFELTFDLFAPGNKPILIRDIGIIELLSQDKQPNCKSIQVAGALGMELLEGKKNRTLAKHLVTDDTTMYLPSVTSFSVNTVQQNQHSFIADSGKAFTVSASFDAESYNPNTMTGAAYCPYFSFSRMDGYARTAICPKFSLDTYIKPDGSKAFHINFDNTTLNLIPESEACLYINQ